MVGEKEIYKHLSILEANTIKQVEMKEKIQKECLRRTRKLLKIKLCSRNFIKGINTWALPLVRYLAPFLKWTWEWTKDKKTNKALHPRDDFDRLCVSRKEGGRGLASIKDSVDASVQWLEDYIEKHKGRPITTIRNDANNMMANKMTITRKKMGRKTTLWAF